MPYINLFILYLCAEFYNPKKKFMKKNVYLLSFLAMSLLIGCDDNNDKNDNQSLNNITITTDQTALNQRLDLTNSGVISVDNVSATGKTTETTNTTFPLVQIAEVKPPVDAMEKYFKRVM